MGLQEQFAKAESLDVADAAKPLFSLSLVPAVDAPSSASEVRHSRPSGLRDASKRALDLLIAVPVLIATAPILLLIWALIRMDSAGPGIFRQTRLGQGGKPFDIVKFRTMVVQENGENVVQCRRNDPRVTRLGAFLRRSSLDELPQLLNVIRGEMSLVGPRPHAWSHDALYSTLIDNYTLRQMVKPGMTGWAQVHGHRGETSTLEAMRRRVDLDIWYARNASFRLDLQILVRTPFEIVYPRNAF